MHPMWSTHGITVDLAKGERLTLEGIFREGSGYREELSRFVTPELLSRCDTFDEGVAEQARPDSSHYENCIIRKSAFGVVFERYSVGPYASGAAF